MIQAIILMYKLLKDIVNVWKQYVRSQVRVPWNSRLCSAIWSKNAAPDQLGAHDAVSIGILTISTPCEFLSQPLKFPLVWTPGSSTWRGRMPTTRTRLSRGTNRSLGQCLHSNSPGYAVWRRPTIGRRGGSSPTSTTASSGQGGGIGNFLSLLTRHLFAD